MAGCGGYFTMSVPTIGTIEVAIDGSLGSWASSHTSGDPAGVAKDAFNIQAWVHKGS